MVQTTFWPKDDDDESSLWIEYEENQCNCEVCDCSVDLEECICQECDSQKCCQGCCQEEEEKE